MLSDSHPALKSLHPDESLSRPKLDAFERLSTEALIASLASNQRECLKVRPDGTILDGHHRIKVLRDRGVDVDRLPREIVPHSAL
jgi:ParB-like chromosome segregation protein Spo0J